MRVIAHGEPNMWWNAYAGITGTVVNVRWYPSGKSRSRGGDLWVTVEFDTPEPCTHCGGIRATTQRLFVSTWEPKRALCRFPMLEHHTEANA